MKHPFVFSILFSILLIFSAPAYADEAKPQAMLIGVFHFSNPGKDVVKIKKHINVLDEDSQKYLVELSKRIIEEFRPTIILLEYEREADARIQARYKDYLDGSYDLPVNELYQLGFRIAKLAGGIPIAPFDEGEVHWNPLPLFEVMPTLAPDIQKAMDKFIEDIVKEFEKDHQTLSLKQLLQKLNEPEADRRNMESYLMTNSVGAGKNFEGALASSSWWHRNFRMYANIQSYAKPGARILVIGGQGHTAILNGFLAIDSRLEGVDVSPLF